MRSSFSLFSSAPRVASAAVARGAAYPRATGVLASSASARVAAASVAPVVSTRSLSSAPILSAPSSSSYDDSRSFVPKPVYSSFKLYKTKTALDLSLVRAVLAWNSPSEKQYLSLKRAGGMRLTFAAGENKTYDWQNSALITLGVTELGDVLAFAANRDQAEHKIFHDPQLGSDAAGQTRKELVLKRIGSGKPGYFFNFSVTEKAASGQDAATSRKWSIAVSEGEMQVFLTLIQQSMPAMLAITIKPKIEDSSYEDKRGGAGASDDSAASSGGSGKKRSNNLWTDSR